MFASAAAGAVALVGACARQGAPPGGPEDRRPPIVLRTEPDTFAMVRDFRGPVRFHFDERISERVEGTVDDAVIVSPVSGDVRVHLGRGSISVDVEGGFEPDRVYRITLLPAVRDMFGNQLRDPFELVFSTGANYSPTVIAGLVWDRISGEGVESAEVRAVAEGADAAVYVAKTDTGGVYGLRYVPRGLYRLVVFQDRNSDGVVDPMELLGAAQTVVESPADTILLSLPTLPADTTPARITRAELLDSVTVVVEFDDYLDPALPVADLAPVMVSDSGAAPAVAAVRHGSEYRAWVQDVTDSLARLDSLDAVLREEEARLAAAEAEARQSAGDSVPPVEEGAAGEETEVPPAEEERVERRPPPSLAGGPGSREAPARPDGSEAPARTIVLVLDGGLVRGWPYRLELGGVTNINGVPGGGGEARLLLEVVVEPEEESPDSSSIGDSILALPDTGGVGRGPSFPLLPRAR